MILFNIWKLIDKKQNLMQVKYRKQNFGKLKIRKMCSKLGL